MPGRPRTAVRYSGTVGLRELTANLEELELVDGASDVLARVVSTAVRPAKSLLSGTWL